MSSRDAAMRYSVLLVLGGILAGFEIGSTGAAQVASAHGAAATAPAVTFTIRLFTLDDVRRLDQRAEIAEVIDTARAYSDSPIFLAAYVTADDVRSNRADATGVADELVIEIGGYLASRGVEPDRISGKRMGIDPAIGSFFEAARQSTRREDDPRIALLVSHLQEDLAEAALLVGSYAGESAPPPSGGAVGSDGRISLSTKETCVGTGRSGRPCSTPHDSLTFRIPRAVAVVTASTANGVTSAAALTRRSM